MDLHWLEAPRKARASILERCRILSVPDTSFHAVLRGQERAHSLRNMAEALKSILRAKGEFVKTRIDRCVVCKFCRTHITALHVGQSLHCNQRPIFLVPTKLPAKAGD